MRTLGGVLTMMHTLPFPERVFLAEAELNRMAEQQTLDAKDICELAERWSIGEQDLRVLLVVLERLWPH